MNKYFSLLKNKNTVFCMAYIKKNKIKLSFESSITERFQDKLELQGFPNKNN